MILLGAIIHHLTHTFAILNFALVLGFDIHLGMYIGEFYCNLTLFLTVFGVGYLYTGSMVMAIFRVLYIKHGAWMRNNNGVFAYIALLGSIIVTVILTTVFTVEKGSKRVIYNACMGYSATYMETIRLYQGRNGNF